MTTEPQHPSCRRVGKFLAPRHEAIHRGGIEAGSPCSRCLDDFIAEENPVRVVDAFVEEPGEPVRGMLIEAVEKRFGAVEALPAGHTLEFLTDNGGAYIAHDSRRIARSLRLTPINTPVCSPRSNGMAESFVDTFRRDYLSRMGPHRRADGAGAVARCVRALQRSPSALEPEDEIAARVQAGTS